MTVLRQRVLVIDDDPATRQVLRIGLSTHDFEMAEADNGSAGLAALSGDRPSKPDLVILDLGLPDIDGLDLLRSLRESGDAMPIVILSCHGDEATKVRAFDLGADDYVTKPFGMGELIARVRVALRHAVQAENRHPLFQLNGLSIDLARRLVQLDGTKVSLSRKEYDLLRLFVRHVGKVLTHEMLMRVLSQIERDPQYVRVYIRQLRSKIERDPSRPAFIITETGVGYRLRAP